MAASTFRRFQIGIESSEVFFRFFFNKIFPVTRNRRDSANRRADGGVDHHRRSASNQHDVTVFIGDDNADNSGIGGGVSSEQPSSSSSAAAEPFQARLLKSEVNSLQREVALAMERARKSESGEDPDFCPESLFDKIRQNLFEKNFADFHQLKTRADVERDELLQRIREQESIGSARSATSSTSVQRFRRILTEFGMQSADSAEAIDNLSRV